MGGDEFVLLLRNMTDSMVLQATMERLMASLRTPIEVGRHRLSIGASVGLACAPDHGVSADALMRHADMAMYKAKRAGLDYAVYASEDDPYTAERLALIADLRTGIEKGATQAVLDGDLDDFIEASLAQKISGAGPVQVEDVD